MSTLRELARARQKSSHSFQPTDLHKRAKYAFWAHFFSTGELPPGNIELATASRLSGFQDELLEWWDLPGFQEWFGNGEEFRQKVEYLATAALDVLQELLLDSNAKTTDRLQAAKMSLEVASKFPKQAAKEAYVDDKIAEMSKKELESYISQKLKVIQLPTDTSTTLDRNTPQETIDKPE